MQINSRLTDASICTCFDYFKKLERFACCFIVSLPLIWMLLKLRRKRQSATCKGHDPLLTGNNYLSSNMAQMSIFWSIAHQRDAEPNISVSILGATRFFYETAAAGVYEHTQRNWRHDPSFTLKMTAKCVGFGEKENKERLFILTVGSSVKARRLICPTSTRLSFVEMKSFPYYPVPRSRYISLPSLNAGFWLKFRCVRPRTPAAAGSWKDLGSTVIPCKKWEMLRG